MNLLSIWNWLNNLPALSNLSVPSTTETSPEILCPGRLENIEGPWWKIYFKLKEVNAFEYLDSSIVTGNGLCDPVHEFYFFKFKGKWGKLILLAHCS